MGLKVFWFWFYFINGFRNDFRCSDFDNSLSRYHGGGNALGIPVFNSLKLGKGIFKSKEFPGCYTGHKERSPEDLEASEGMNRMGRGNS